MRTLAILAVSAAALLAGPAMAQPAPAAPSPASPAAEAPPPPAPGGWHGQHGPMDHGPMQQGRMGWRHHGGPMAWMRQFALIYPTADRNLSAADVQKIAEAFLLFNGNHTWKVVNVTEQPESVTFSYATPDGTPIATFRMDRHTGRPQRVS